MKQYCHAHPAAPAHWFCRSCGKALCLQCVDSAVMEGLHPDEQPPVCPHCNISLQRIKDADGIDPLWLRIPQFSRYLFSLHPLLLLLILGGMATIFSGPGVTALLATMAIWGISLKYAYVMLQHTAEGVSAAPRLTTESLLGNFAPVLRQAGLFFVIILVAGLIAKSLGTFSATLFIVVCVLFLPSMIILLAATDTLIQAVNPLLFTALAYKIGWGYLLMYVSSLLLGGMPVLLIHHAVRWLPATLQIFLLTLVKIYAIFITYHLMGYLILKHREDIGDLVDIDH